MLQGFLTAFGTLFAIIAILFLAFISTKYIGKYTGLKKFAGKSRYMAVIDQILLGQDASAAIVKVSGRVFLLGITQHEVTLLADLSEDRLSALPQGDEPSGSGIDFKEIIGKIRDRKK